MCSLWFYHAQVISNLKLYAHTHTEIKINKLYNCSYNISPAALSVMEKEGCVGGNVSSAS